MKEKQVTFKLYITEIYGNQVSIRIETYNLFFNWELHQYGKNIISQKVFMWIPKCVDA